MRRLMHFLCLGLLAITYPATAGAQGMKDPTHWTYEAKKIAADEYELSFKLQLDEGWHIWSVNVGGDGYQVIPSFTYTEKKSVKLIGTLKETGALISTIMEGVEGKVNYYSHTVTYTQKIKTNNTTVSGTHEYQVCNESMCLPPKEVPFSFQLN